MKFLVGIVFCSSIIFAEQGSLDIDLCLEKFDLCQESCKDSCSIDDSVDSKCITLCRSERDWCIDKFFNEDD